MEERFTKTPAKFLEIEVNFDTIVGNVESHARWLARITG